MYCLGEAYRTLRRRLEVGPQLCELFVRRVWRGDPLCSAKKSPRPAGIGLLTISHFMPDADSLSSKPTRAKSRRTVSRLAIPC